MTHSKKSTPIWSAKTPITNRNRNCGGVTGLVKVEEIYHKSAGTLSRQENG